MKPSSISAELLFEKLRDDLRWEWNAGQGHPERRFHEAAVRDAQGAADLGKIVSLEIAQQDRFAIGLAELAQRLIEVRGNPLPSGLGIVAHQSVHGHGFLFAGPAPFDGAHRLCGDVSRGGMQPSRQRGTPGQLRRTSRQREEHALGYVFGEVWITNDSSGGGMDEIKMAPHQFGKGRFGAPVSVGAQELRVSQIVHRCILAAGSKFRH